MTVASTTICTTQQQTAAGVIGSRDIAEYVYYATLCGARPCYTFVMCLLRSSLCVNYLFSVLMLILFGILIVVEGTKSVVSVVSGQAKL